MIDMSELMFDADFIQPVKIPILRGVGDWNGNGLYDPDAFTSFTVTMIIQHSTKAMLQALPEGERNEDYINWWLNPKMIMADGITVQLSDVIIWREKYYRVVRRSDRSDNGFYTGIAQWAPHLAGLADILPKPEEEVFSISGTIRVAMRLASVRVNLQGTRSTHTFTDVGGSYRFDNLPRGTYIITPVLAGFEFNPRSILLTLPVSEP